MTKPKKRRFWIAAVIVLVAMVALFSPKADSVTAMFSDTHVCDVLLRFMDEASKSPAGQYYELLVWKHWDELKLIFNNNPEHANKETLRVIRMFIPGLEAWLDGKGDTVQITGEQVKSLEAELDWLSSFASPSLREDIEKEQQRFSLENFIGMTMSEAWDYVNSNWPPELTRELAESILMQTEVPTAVVTETPQFVPTPICIAGPGPDCLTEPSLVPDSNGSLVYYVFNGVYFEYPSSWHIAQLAGQQKFLYIRPALDSPEASNMGIGGVNLFAAYSPIENVEQYDLLTLRDKAIVQRPLWNHTVPTDFVWMYPVSMADFEGVEFLWKNQNALQHLLEVLIYAENDQIAVDLMAFVKTAQTTGPIDNPNAVNENFPNFQHIAESFRILKP